MTSQGDTARSAKFGRLALVPAVLLNTKTVLMHLFVMQMIVPSFTTGQMVVTTLCTPVLVTAVWFGLYAAVVRLTAVESKFWKMRLPVDVVRRALHYDAVYASVLSLPAWVVTLAYLCLVLGSERFALYQVAYLYALSAAIVVAGIGLFYVYATSMKSLMYANR